MKTLKIILLLLLFSNGIYSSAQDSIKTDISEKNRNWSVGLQVNHIGAISVKKYTGKFALELIAGRSSYRNYYHAFRKNFINHSDTRIYHFDGYELYDIPWKVQLRLVRHNQVKRVKGLEWYYGGGIHSRFASGYYDQYRIENSSRIYDRKKINFFATGVDLAIGLEYTFRKFPVSVFGDSGFYIEAYPSPFYMQKQTIIGARYNF
jgi:hypothetical protein